jgi:predicted lipid-binding transport protein (Tim44 family)
MRSVLIASLTLALLAPAAALAQEGKPPPPQDIAPAPLPDAAPVAPPGDGPHPGDPAPPPPAVTPGGPLHPGDENLPPDANKPPPPEKPKLGEAAGGLAGGILGQVAGTAVGGPLGGIAASFVGDNLGGGAVRMGKRMFGRGKKPAEQAAAAPAESQPTAAVEPVREPAPADAQAVPVETESPS